MHSLRGLFIYRLDVAKYERDIKEIDNAFCETTKDDPLDLTLLEFRYVISPENSNVLGRVFPTVERRLTVQRVGQQSIQNDWAPVPSESVFRRLFSAQVLSPSLLRRSDRWMFEVERTSTSKTTRV